MAPFGKIVFARLVLRLGMCVFLAAHTDCRSVNVPGTVTNTKATNFPWFFDRIANPCESSPASGNTVQGSSSTTMAYAVTSVTQVVPSMDFYHSMKSSLKIALEKLQTLESTDPSLPDCNGISLDSLPVTPMLDSMNDGQTIRQAYKTIIYLATHFHLMSSDREMPASGENVAIADQQLEPAATLPVWRFQRCGNETENFPSILIDVTGALENILCIILSSATTQQTQSFREPLNSLQATTLYRYHASCSFLQTRDCLVVREAKQALGLVSRKYGQLIQQAANATLDIESSDNFDEMDNSI